MEAVDLNYRGQGCGGEVTIRGMDDDSRMEIGRKTLRFVRQMMRDPDIRAKVKVRAAELRELNRIGRE